MLLDVSPPRLGALVVAGRLKFNNTNLELSVDSIVVHGLLEVGTEAQPFTASATIRVNGVRSSRVTIVDAAYFLGPSLAEFGAA